jgi:hypothetical protein
MDASDRATRTSAPSGRPPPDPASSTDGGRLLGGASAPLPRKAVGASLPLRL